MSTLRTVTVESFEALVSGDKDQLRERVHAYFRHRREVGCIDDEISEKLGLGHNSVAPRRNELEEAGLVTKLFNSNGQRVRRKTRQGCFAGVYVAIEFSPATSVPRGSTLAHMPPSQQSLFGDLSPERHRDDG